MDESAIPPLLGVIGHPIAGNPMQFAMEQALEAAGLDWRFLSFDVAPGRLADAIVGINALGFRGLAVAPPHAEAALEFVAARSPTARLARWADAISRNEDGSLVADNLVGDALRLLLAPERIAGAAMGLVGSTPENTAAVTALFTARPQSLQVEDAPIEPFTAAVEQLGTATLPLVSHVSERDDVLMSELRVLIRGAASRPAVTRALERQIACLRDDCIVVDLAESASSSPLLRTATDRGLKTVSTIDLLVARTSLAFRQWTGRAASEVVLRESFEEYLEI